MANEWTRWWIWFFLGTSFALFGQWYFLIDGQWSTLLRVGKTSELRPRLEAELGAIPPVADHDGQLYYVIARDPFARDFVPESFHDGYRYRRILYPFLAGGAGSFSPKLTLCGLVMLAAIGCGLTAAALAVWGERLHLYPWCQLFALLNPGLFYSAMLLTPDALSMGLGMSAIPLVINRHYRWAIFFLVLAVLTKETAILFPFGFALWFLGQRQVRSSVMVAIIPLAVLLLWNLIVSGIFPTQSSLIDPLLAPLQGIREGLRVWNYFAFGEFISAKYVLYCLVGATISLIFCREQLIRSLLLPWIALALVADSSVWNLGNNVLRALAPAWSLAGMAFLELVTRATNRKNQ